MITWLGFVIDLLTGKIFLTVERIEKTETLIDYVLKLQSVPIKLLAKISGLIISMENSHGELVYLRAWFISLCIAEAPTWQTKEILCPPVREELIFWQTAIRAENGQYILPPVAASKITYSDARATGSAMVVTDGRTGQKLIAVKQFQESEIAGSSTERELLGILHGLVHFKHVLFGQSVAWHTDCKTWCV